MQRLIIASSMLLVAGGASASNIQAYLAYGNSTFAALNGASVGQALPTDRSVNIPSSGNSFDIQICFKNIGTTAQTYRTGALMLGYDTRSGTDAPSFTDQSAANAAGLYKKLTVNRPLFDWNNSLPGIHRTNGTAGTTGVTGIGGSYGTTYSNDSFKPLGLSSGLAFAEPGSSYDLRLEPGVTVRFATARVVNRQVFVGEVFGDNEMYGLGLYGVAGAVTRNTMLVTDKDHYDVSDTVSYRLMAVAVPEPATWAILGLGALVLLRSRRR